MNKRDRNMLTLADNYKLLRYFDTTENRSKLLQGTDKEVAEEASKALNLKLTSGNISGVRRALGVNKRTERKVKTKIGTVRDRVKALEERLSAIEEILTKPQA
jgi:hypothetical protein